MAQQIHNNFIEWHSIVYLQKDFKKSIFCLENTDLENTDLENADLENADFENTDLANKELENTDVSQTL